MCTGIPVMINGRLVFARTMEFGIKVNSELRYYPTKTAFRAPIQVSDDGTTEKNGKSWSSKYAILGPNTLGSEQVIEGINDQGLNVAGFYFPGYAEYEPFPAAAEKEKETIGPLDLTTLLLTTCSSLEDVRVTLDAIHVCPVFFAPLGEVPPIHWIVQQETGEALVIEYLNGKLTLQENPLNVITNAPDFTWQTTNLRNYVNLSAINAKPKDLVDDPSKMVMGFGQGSGMLGLPGDFTPPSRFVRAVALSQVAARFAGNEYPTDHDGAVNLAWNLIANINIPIGAAVSTEHPDELDYTQWVSVSDISRRRYYFRDYDNMDIRFVDLNKLATVTTPIAFAMNQQANYQEITEAGQQLSGT